MKKILILILLLICNSHITHADIEYYVEVSHNDEFFIINGEKYSAKTYCFNMEEGDRVIFIEGNAFGSCVSATVVNLRTKNICDLWCE